MLYDKENVIQRIARYLSEVFCGTVSRVLNLILPVRERHWVFGSDYGRSFRESSKYLLLYMLENHKDYDCCFVADTAALKKELESKGIPAVTNNSIRGIVKICRADAVFCSQNMNDIRYAFRKKGRSYYYMTHGLPYKICREALPAKSHESSSLKGRLLELFGYVFCQDYDMKDVSFVPGTSDFLAPHLSRVIGHGVPVKILGTPRNDMFFNHDFMKNEKWIDGTDGKKIITYMPTHRQYGNGQVTPTPFEKNIAVQQWFREHNVLFLMKQHPNMITKMTDVFSNDVIKDITELWIDPQVVMYHSDILISDYSSAPLDFLIFRRPTIYYFYDDYKETEGSLYDVIPDFPNTICYSEDELFECIRKSIEHPDMMSPTDEVVAKYHKFVDDKSSERYYKAVVAEKYGE